MALADVYDALTSRRTYRDPTSHDEAVKVIAHIKGKHLDPDVVDAFLEIHDQFYAAALTYQDTAEDMQQKQAYLDRSKPD